MPARTVVVAVGTGCALTRTWADNNIIQGRLSEFRVNANFLCLLLTRTWSWDPLLARTVFAYRRQVEKGLAGGRESSVAERSRSAEALNTRDYATVALILVTVASADSAYLVGAALPSHWLDSCPPRYPGLEVLWGILSERKL